MSLVFTLLLVACARCVPVRGCGEGELLACPSADGTRYVVSDTDAATGTEAVDMGLDRDAAEAYCDGDAASFCADAGDSG